MALLSHSNRKTPKFMNYFNQSTKYVALGITTFLLMFGVLSVVPTQAYAFDVGQLIDPFCLFACDDNSEPSTVNNTYTNSNNVNSNINSPGATVNAGGSHTTTPAQVVAYNTPVYNYNYDYNNQYHSTQPNYPSLQISCYANSSSVHTGDTVNWYANISGGNGSYYSTWTGTDGLSGYGSSISKTYYSNGSKTASITVTSAGQTITRSCGSSVNVYADTYNNNYNYNPQPVYQPTYYPQTYNYYSPLSVTCNVSGANYNNSNSVTWNAYPSGGNGSYSYSWSGTDNLYGTGQSAYYTYPNPGLKYAYVTVYSNGQSVSQNCGTINVGNYVYGTAYNSYNYNTNINSNNGLDVACYVDPTTARINQPVTWRAEVTGGIAPYTYSWTGSDNLSGTDNVAIKYYSTTGNKSGLVTIKSADGRTATRACSTALTVRSATVAPTTPAAPVQPVVQPAPQPQQQQENGLSAAALFSLKNVPWGWVAILIILVLFATVAYLLFNRPKI